MIGKNQVEIGKKSDAALTRASFLLSDSLPIPPSPLISPHFKIRKRSHVEFEQHRHLMNCLVIFTLLF